MSSLPSPAPHHSPVLALPDDPPVAIPANQLDKKMVIAGASTGLEDASASSLLDPVHPSVTQDACAVAAHANPPFGTDPSTSDTLPSTPVADDNCISTAGHSLPLPCVSPSLQPATITAPVNPQVDSRVTSPPAENLRPPVSAPSDKDTIHTTNPNP